MEDPAGRPGDGVLHDPLRRAPRRGFLQLPARRQRAGGVRRRGVRSGLGRHRRARPGRPLRGRPTGHRRCRGAGGFRSCTSHRSRHRLRRRTLRRRCRPAPVDRPVPGAGGLPTALPCHHRRADERQHQGRCVLSAPGRNRRRRSRYLVRPGRPPPHQRRHRHQPRHRHPHSLRLRELPGRALADRQSRRCRPQRKTSRPGAAARSHRDRHHRRNLRDPDPVATGRGEGCAARAAGRHHRRPSHPPARRGLATLRRRDGGLGRRLRLAALCHRYQRGRRR